MTHLFEAKGNFCKVSGQTSLDPKLEIPTFHLLELQVTYKTNRNRQLKFADICTTYLEMTGL